jgi:hypothetical protein
MQQQFHDHSQTRQLWRRVGGFRNDPHGDAYWDRPDTAMKWLVYFYDAEDYTLFPVAIAEAEDAEEAARRAVAAGVWVRGPAVRLRARRLTLDIGEGREPAEVIECVECGRTVTSWNGAFCARCLEGFVGARIDRVKLISK